MWFNAIGDNPVSSSTYASPICESVSQVQSIGTVSRICEQPNSRSSEYRENPPKRLGCTREQVTNNKANHGAARHCQQGRRNPQVPEEYHQQCRQKATDKATAIYSDYPGVPSRRRFPPVYVIHTRCSNRAW